jgi:hypothetical protein
MHESITMAEVGSIVKVSGQQDRDPVGTAQAGKHAHEDAEREPDHHEREDLPREQDLEAVQQESQRFHGGS